MTRKLKLRYLQYENLEWAVIETQKGWYVTEVHRCSDEGRKKFRQRARALQFALEKYPYPLLTTSPEEN
ncbi:MAG: hypothetical protein ACE5KG_06030 [Nitrososphaerales archaeon]